MEEPAVVRKSKNVTNKAFEGVVSVVTLLYHRFFTNITLNPALAIAEHMENGARWESTEFRTKLYALLSEWRDGKKDEVNFVSVACVALSAIVAATLAWPSVLVSYWIGPAAWYATLILAIFGIFMAAQQISLLSLVDDLPDDAESCPPATLERHLHQVLFRRQTGPYEEWAISWKSIFVWQLPMMTFAYSFLLFFVGLTIVVCTPLLHVSSGNDFNTAIFYIVAAVLAVAVFVYSSLRGYTNIDQAIDKTHANRAKVKGKKGQSNSRAASVAQANGTESKPQFDTTFKQEQSN